MRPILFALHVGGRELGLHTYGLLVALGFTLGILLMWKTGKREGFDGGRLLDLAFWGLVAGLVGSRLTYVIVNARAFAEACFGSGTAEDGRIVGCAAALKFWEGGMVFYGGAIASTAVVGLFCRREHWSFWRLADVAAPTLALGHAIGRLGCFFAGCCFGKACTAPWAVSFPPGSVAHDELAATGVIGPYAAGTLPLHPTQLYEAVGELLIFGLLLYLRRRWRLGAERPSATREAPTRAGALFLAYAAAYVVLRFVLEIFRGDAARGYVAEWTSPRLAHWLGLPPGEALFLSVSQVVSLLMLGAIGAAYLWRRRRRFASAYPTGTRAS